MTDRGKTIEWADDLNVAADKLECIDHALESAARASSAIEGAQAILNDIADRLRALAAEITGNEPAGADEEGAADAE